jgi:hypothetical protein
MKSDVEEYFEFLGYTVTWDFKASTRETWWEIMKDSKGVCQIDTGVPVTSIIEDFICLHLKKSPTSKYDYKINAPESVEFDELLKKIYEHSKIQSVVSTD